MVLGIFTPCGLDGGYGRWWRRQFYPLKRPCFCFQTAQDHISEDWNSHINCRDNVRSYFIMIFVAGFVLDVKYFVFKLCGQRTPMKIIRWQRVISVLWTAILNGVHTRVHMVLVEIYTGVQMLCVVGSVWMNGCAVGAVLTGPSPLCGHELCKPLLAYVLTLLHLCRPVLDYGWLPSLSCPFVCTLYNIHNRNWSLLVFRAQTNLTNST
jgi:hypothetical protein